MKNKKTISIIFLFLTALFWGYSFLFIDELIDCGWSSLGIGVARGCVGIVCLLIGIKEKWWKNLKICLSSIIIGVVLSLGYIFQVEGQKMTSPSNAALFSSLNVILVPIISFIFFKKKLSIQIIISALIAFIGIFILNYDGNIKAFDIGDLLNFLAVLCFAIQIAFLSNIDGKNYMFSVTGFQLITVGVISGILMLFRPNESHFSFDSKSILNVILLIVLASFLAFVLQARSSPNLNPSLCSIIIAQQSLFGVIISILYGKEDFKIQLLIGGLIIFVAIFISVFDFSRLKRKKTIE